MFYQRIESNVQNNEEKDKLFSAIDNVACINQKAVWVSKSLNGNQNLLTILIGLYSFIFIRCFYLSINARDRFCRLVIGGLSLVFISTLFINIGMVIGLLPVVGMPLPLISQGGSSLISFYIAFGIIISMASHKKLVPR